MSDNKVTLDQLDNSAVEAMSSSVGDVSMLNTENKTIVGAISEIVGKKEIANAIGEPLAETDKFTEMSSEINGLLSTFKTNMMNAGVVVESGDKFKALIDKIKGLTEGEGNKGVRFISGNTTDIFDKTHNSIKLVDVEIELDFEPSIILIISDFTTSTIGLTTDMLSFALYDNLERNKIFFGEYGIDNSKTFTNSYFLNPLVEENKYYLPITYAGSSTIGLVSVTLNQCTWYAIGVGEEDTTLRDSLASILQEEGVSVTEEDDMASLISKVDSEFDRKNTEIDYMIQGLTSALVNKGVKLDTDDDFESLLNAMNDMEYNPEIYYLIENGQFNNELEWSYTDKGEQRDSSYYLPSSGEAQGLRLRDIVAIKTYKYLNLEINVINNSTSSHHQYLAIYDASNELVDYQYISGSTTIDRKVLKIDISNIAKGFSFSLTSGTNVSVEVFNCYISKE